MLTTELVSNGRTTLRTHKTWHPARKGDPVYLILEEEFV